VNTRIQIISASLLIFAVNLVVYLLTLSPTLQFIDSGELAVVCKTLSIAHPTGYPLYTLLGRLFSLFPLKDIIFRVNMMSLVFICAGNLLLFFTLLSLNRSFVKKKEGSSRTEIWPAFLTALIFSFTPTLWSQAVSNEVYALNVLLFDLILFLVLIWRNSWREPGGERTLCLLIFIYGLSFGNHMSTILLSPALLFLLIMTYGRDLFSAKRLIPRLGLFFLGLSIYVFLPLRSSQNPVMDWGNPQSWATFKSHVTGWQYQVWMFAGSTGAIVLHLKNFIKLFFHQFPVYLLPLTVLGGWRLWVSDRRILIFFSILFLACVLYGINYEIPDIDAYFLSAFVVNAIFMGTGLYSIIQTVEKSKIRKNVSFLFIIMLVVLPLILLKKNYHQADRSRDHFAYDLASNIMRSARKDAVIVTNEWDHYSPWLYLRWIEYKRPDVKFLDVELCRRSWYFDYIQRNFANLYRNSENEINRFVSEVYPFENRQPFNSQIIEDAYVSMLSSFLTKNYDTAPLYDDVLGEAKFEKPYFKVPEGMIFSLKDSQQYFPYDIPVLEMRGILDKSIYKDDRTLFTLKRYPYLIDFRLRYLSYYKQDREVEILQDKYRKLLEEPIR
jgi:hypothetical protein